MVLLLGTLTAGCAPQVQGLDDQSDSEAELSRVPETVKVNGRTYDVEDDYLPRVVMCENPDAPSEALRAQAIAARTYVTYKYRVEGRTSIRDGQEDQVFSCAANQYGALVSPQVRAAVKATVGQIVLHNGQITAGFFVAGARRDTSCQPTDDPTNTERFVTFNAGRSGSAVRASTIGTLTDPANRGALGQNLSNCLALRNHYSATQILAHFYGVDISVKNEQPAPPAPPLPADDPAMQPMTATSTETPTTTTGPTCWSFMLQDNVPVGTCVQYQGDMQWYQCTTSGAFRGPVVDGSGPVGTCVKEYPLQTP